MGERVTSREFQFPLLWLYSVRVMLLNIRTMQLRWCLAFDFKNDWREKVAILTAES